MEQLQNIVPCTRQQEITRILHLRKRARKKKVRRAAKLFKKIPLLVLKYEICSNFINKCNILCQQIKRTNEIVLINFEQLKSDIIISDVNIQTASATIVGQSAIYIVGGYDEKFKFYIPDTYKLNLFGESQELAPLLNGRGYLNLAIIHSKLYAIGGFGNLKRGKLSDLEVLDIFKKGQQWKSLAPIPCKYDYITTHNDFRYIYVIAQK